MKYKGGELEIEGRQYKGTIKSATDICQWANDLDNDPDKLPEDCIASFDYIAFGVTRFQIKTIYGLKHVAKGNYVIKKKAGQFVIRTELLANENIKGV